MPHYCTNTHTHSQYSLEEQWVHNMESRGQSMQMTQHKFQLKNRKSVKSSRNRFLIRPDRLLIYRDMFYLEYLCKNHHTFKVKF